MQPTRVNERWRKSRMVTTSEFLDPATPKAKIRTPPPPPPPRFNLWPNKILGFLNPTWVGVSGIFNQSILTDPRRSFSRTLSRNYLITTWSHKQKLQNIRLGKEPSFRSLEGRCFLLLRIQAKRPEAAMCWRLDIRYFLFLIALKSSDVKASVLVYKTYEVWVLRAAWGLRPIPRSALPFCKTLAILSLKMGFHCSHIWLLPPKPIFSFWLKSPSQRKHLSSWMLLNQLWQLCRCRAGCQPIQIFLLLSFSINRASEELWIHWMNKWTCLHKTCRVKFPLCFSI